MGLLDDVFGQKEVKKEVNSAVENISSIVDLTKKDKNQLTDLSYNLGSWSFVALIFLVPLLFVPFLADAFDLPKQTLFFILSALGLTFIALRNVFSSKATLVRTPFTLPILLLVAIAVASSFFADNRYVALTADTIILSAGALLFFLLIHLGDKDSNFVSKSVRLLLFSGALMSLLTIVQWVIYLAQTQLHLNINLNYFFLSPNFSPSGSSLTQALFLIVLLPLGHFLLKEKTKYSFLSTAALILCAVGFVLSLLAINQNHPILLDHVTSWKIATGTLGESPTRAIIGMGPGHYVDAFTINKPLAFNSGLLWNLRFSTASNLYFYLLTTLGIGGLACFIFLMVRFLTIARSRLQVDNISELERGLIISLGLLLVLFLALPAPLVSLFLFFVLLGLLVVLHKNKGVSLYASETAVGNNALLRYGPAALSLALTLFVGYHLARNVLGDFYFAQSVQAFSRNDGVSTYNFQIKALDYFPENVNYRISYSQTNLALANALAGQPNLSDQQKQTVISLVQQSLREGRLAAGTEPRRAAAWENLTGIYRNLINFAQGADQWAVASQNQAISLDPANPRLRLDLGGIFFALRDFQSAGQIFIQAVNLKGDYANAHYNLAQALKELKINDQALQQLQLTATLVCATDRNSPDCLRVNTEVTDLQKSLAEAAQAATPAAKPVVPTVQEPLASPAAQKSNIPNAKTQPPAQISTQSGEISR